MERFFPKGAIKVNSISNLVKQNLKQNKTKSTLVVITIILTTCLLTSIGILSYSIQQMFIEDIVSQCGTAHARYKELSQEQIQILKKHEKIKKVGEYIDFGYSKDEKIGTNFLNFFSVDENSMEMMNIKLAHGRLPQKSNEIAMEKWMLEKIKATPKIGEKIKLEYVRAKKEGLVYEGEKEFILTGILEDNLLGKSMYSSTGLVSKNFIEEIVEPKEIIREEFVQIDGRRNIEKSIYEIGDKIGIKRDNIKINTQYIKSSGGNIKALIPFIIIGIVVIFAAVIVIYNIFHISIVERRRQLGLLSALGATKKQLKKVILREGITLSFLGIPAGLALGFLLSMVVIPLLQVDLSFKTSPIVYIVSALLSLLTVIISLRKPMKMASKVSPMESIRFTGVEVGTKKKSRKSHGDINIKRMAYLNLWRNKRRTIMTLLSLTMSGMLFIISSSVLSSMNVDNLTKGYIRSDVQLTANYLHVENNTDPLTKELVNKIKSIDGVKEVDILKYGAVQIENRAKIKAPDGIVSETLSCDLYGYDDGLLKELEKYLVEGEISAEDLNSGNKVLVVKEREDILPFHVGDKIKVKRFNKETGDMVSVELTIVGTVEKNIAWIGWRFMGPTFITTEETCGNILNDNRIGRICVNISDEDFDETHTKIKSIAEKDENITFMSQKEFKEEQERSLLGIKVASMSLVTIIGLIGVVNVINTMITSILTRKKEIGMIQAIGLTDLQLKKMLQSEGLYYAIISGVLSIVGGTGLGYIFYLLFKQDASYAQYKFPLIQVLGVAIIFVVVQILITYLVEKNLKKDSIIERIRYSE